MRSSSKHLLIALLSFIVLLPAAFAQNDDIDDLTRKAKNGDAVAQARLGWDYAKGSGVTQDYNKANYWYRKAANQGNSDGESNLGWMYEKGNGLAQDYSQAAFWYQKAAAQGDTFAENSLGVLYEKGQGVDQSFSQAATWYRKAADQGYSYGEYNLGLLYAYGKGTAVNKQEAAKWFKLAAAQGDEDARNQLAKLQNSDDDNSNTTNTNTNTNTSTTPSGTPLTRAELEDFLRNGMPVKGVLTLVQTYGVDFSLSSSIRSQFSKLGADSSLLSAISSGKR